MRVSKLGGDRSIPEPPLASPKLCVQEQNQLPIHSNNGSREKSACHRDRRARDLHQVVTFAIMVISQGARMSPLIWPTIFTLASMH